MLALAMAMLAVVGVSSAMAAPSYSMLGEWSTGYLEGGARGPTNGSYDITSMDMASGAFSGTAVVEGVSFAVEGTESGSLAVYTLSEGGYVAEDTLPLSKQANGHIGGEGSFDDNGGSQGSGFWAEEVSEQRSSSTKLSCSTSAGSAVSKCTAQVSDTSGASAAIAPSGSVAFTALAGSTPAGSFEGEPACTLSAQSGGSSSSCSISYKHAAPGKVSGRVTLTASYKGDANFATSSANLVICADAEKLELDSINWTGRHDHGFEINAPVVLNGCGLAAGMKVRWGNDAATTKIESGEASADGTSAKIRVPWAATAGEVSISNGEETATLAEDQPTDSWRNTQGFNFHNFDAERNLNDFQAAFTNVTDDQGFPLPQPLKFFTVEKKNGDNQGVCFGISYLSSALADASTNVDEFGTAEDTFGLTQASVSEAIDIDQWKQFSTATLPYREHIPSSGPALKAALEAAFKREGATNGTGFYNPAVLSVKWATRSVGKTGKPEVHIHGHAVTAYAVREDYPAEGQFTIYLYDSNFQFEPGEDSSEALHNENQSDSEIVVNEDGSWHDNVYGASGGPGSIIVYPIAALEGPLQFGLTSTAAAHETLTELAPGTGVEAVNNPATGKPASLEAGESEGITFEAEDDGSVQEATNAYKGPGAGGISSILGPTGTWKETLASTSGELGAQWLGSGGSASLQASPGHDTIAFDSHSGAVSLAPAAGQSASPGGTLSLYENDASKAGTVERVLSVSGPLVKDRIKASFASGGAVELSSAASGRFHVVLSIAGAGVSGQTYDLGTVALGKGQRLLVHPASWTHLTSAQLSATVYGAHGAARRLRLHNRFRVPAASLLHGSLTDSAKAGQLSVELRLPKLQPGLAAVKLSAVARQRGHVLARVKGSVTLGKTTADDVLRFARRLPKGTKVQLTVLTQVGGTTPGSASRRASFVLHG